MYRLTGTFPSGKRFGLRTPTHDGIVWGIIAMGDHIRKKGETAASVILSTEDPARYPLPSYIAHTGYYASENLVDLVHSLMMRDRAVEAVPSVLEASEK